MIGAGRTLGARLGSPPMRIGSSRRTVVPGQSKPQNKRRGTRETRETVMPDNGVTGATALVTGASRGFGRGIATALSKAGAQVVGVARDRAPLEELRAELGESFTAVPADAADPTVVGQLTDAYRPGILV